ncbi:Hypothetical_protein [Hexamita inflata]|uniref:Hypothetical_protein n=1 Tax=Hexamita inflata TaxID=28002 RepID=A0ABP1HYH5_9EUKA
MRSTNNTQRATEIKYYSELDTTSSKTRARTQTPTWRAHEAKTHPESNSREKSSAQTGFEQHDFTCLNASKSPEARCSEAQNSHGRPTEPKKATEPNTKSKSAAFYISGYGVELDCIYIKEIKQNMILHFSKMKSIQLFIMYIRMSESCYYLFSFYDEQIFYVSLSYLTKNFSITDISRMYTTVPCLQRPSLFPLQRPSLFTYRAREKKHFLKSNQIFQYGLKLSQVRPQFGFYNQDSPPLDLIHIF